jgi:hypothetical protein
MYDTVSLKHITTDFIKWHNLVNVREITEQETGLVKMSGKLGNLQINEIQNGIKVFGSYPKYFLGNNLETLTRDLTIKATEKLSDELHLKMENSVMFRFDMAQNFIMQSRVINYLNCLDELGRFKKSIVKKNIYFDTNRKQLIFYDKIAEMRNKRQMIPDCFKQYAGRILRFEMRYLRGLKRTFDRQILLKDLTNESFYIELIKEWKSLYFQINKKNKLKFNDMALKNVKQFQIQLMLIGLNSLGIDEVNNMIEFSRDELGRYQVKRIKDKIKQIKKTKELTEVNPLISELDSKVKNANPYYR